MNTKMKDVKIVTTVEGRTLTITFREAVAKGEKFNPDVHETFASMEFSANELNNLIVEQAVMHGLKQKLVDNLAMTKESKDATTVSDSIKMTKELWQQLLDGHWNAPTRTSKAPSITLSDMEKKFLAGVEAGITTYEQAAELYKMATGKDLPRPEVSDEE